MNIILYTMRSLIILGIILFSISMFSQTEINDDNATSKLLNKNNKLIFVDFYATWCGPCKMMDPIIEELANEYGNKVSFYRMDVDKNKLDDTLGVTAMPTYYFIMNSKTLAVEKGAMSKDKMRKLLDKHIGGKEGGALSHEKEFSQENIDAIWNDFNKLNSLAWHAYENHEDVKSIVTSLKLVKRSIELNKNYYNLDTYAALLYKTGSYTEALKKANKAIL